MHKHTTTTPMSGFPPHANPCFLLLLQPGQAPATAWSGLAYNHEVDKVILHIQAWLPAAIRTADVHTRPHWPQVVPAHKYVQGRGEQGQGRWGRAGEAGEAGQGRRVRGMGGEGQPCKSWME